MALWCAGRLGDSRHCDALVVNSRAQGIRVVEFVPWRNKTRWLNTILDCEGSGDGHSVA